MKEKYLKRFTVVLANVWPLTIRLQRVVIVPHFHDHWMTLMRTLKALNGDIDPIKTDWNLTCGMSFSHYSWYDLQRKHSVLRSRVKWLSQAGVCFWSWRGHCVCLCFMYLRGEVHSSRLCFWCSGSTVVDKWAENTNPFPCIIHGDWLNLRELLRLRRCRFLEGQTNRCIPSKTHTHTHSTAEECF